MIARINEQFVPVWVDVRTRAIPLDGEVWKQVALRTKLDEHRQVCDLFSEGFFLRSLVLTPDGATLLNPQAATPEASLETYNSHGHFAYAQVKTPDYLTMLDGALRRFHQPE